MTGITIKAPRCISHSSFIPRRGVEFLRTFKHLTKSHNFLCKGRSTRLWMEINWEVLTNSCQVHRTLLTRGYFLGREVSKVTPTPIHSLSVGIQIKRLSLALQTTQWYPMLYMEYMYKNKGVKHTLYKIKHCVPCLSEIETQQSNSTFCVKE